MSRTPQGLLPEVLSRRKDHLRVCRPETQGEVSLAELQI